MLSKLLTFLVFILLTYCTHAQSNADTLLIKRKLFHSVITENGKPLSKPVFSLRVAASPKWSTKNRIANILLPAGPVVASGGLYLCYDAIKGVPMVATVNGKDYPYVVRSLPKLLAGMAAFVTGLSMVESANETKYNAVQWYNGSVKKQSQAHVDLKLGITASGQLGLALNF